ncbi:TRAP transporter small permease subunit [Granulosicoccaceae sp. 1_MG-2023]|nr:TRAP transporter small permease subunit [Granulosicoccaceae sp. 1_MG-2023]
MNIPSSAEIPLADKSVAPYRLLAGFVVAFALTFLINNVLTFWGGAPGALNTLTSLGLLPFDPDDAVSGAGALAAGLAQLLLYIAALVWVVFYVRRRTGADGILRDVARYQWLAAYIVRAAFWAVVLVGLADYVVSFLRVENFLSAIVGDELSTQLGRPQFRGIYLHYPLVALAFLIAAFTRSLSFIWLATLVVLAEFQIVLLRFVFSYEQAFMGDLVRFWYAALFLFASSYALVEEAHVRVDVLYAHFGRRKKAWTNALGSVFLGWPICFTILLLGMWGRGSSLNSPLLSYEITQSGFGMYVKYLMAGYLVVFAVSMIVQFAAYLLESVAVLAGYEEDEHVFEPTSGLTPHTIE